MFKCPPKNHAAAPIHPNPPPKSQEDPYTGQEKRSSEPEQKPWFISFADEKTFLAPGTRVASASLFPGNELPGQRGRPGLSSKMKKCCTGIQV